jgi:hypothetical protein
MHRTQKKLHAAVVINVGTHNKRSKKQQRINKQRIASMADRTIVKHNTKNMSRTEINYFVSSSSDAGR